MELNPIQKQQMAQIEKMVFIGTKEIPVRYKAPNKKCNCKGKDGQAKKLYHSEKEALDTAHFQSAEIGLAVYPCPSGLGWHLTKSGGMNF